MNNFNAFTAQLNAFIDKYYKNTLFKGIILSVGLLTGVFLFVNFIEIFYFLSSFWRLVLLLIFVGVFLFSLFYWILIPLVKIYGHSSLRIFRRMTLHEAAVLLSKKYPELDDNFYNVLELNSVTTQNKARNNDAEDVTQNSPQTLLQAAIEQISGRFLFYRFTNSIQYKNNKKYFKYIAVPLVLLILAVIFYPSQIVKSSNRIIHYSTFFEKEFPFTVTIENSNLETQYEEDFTLKISVTGDMLPAEISIAENISGSVSMDGRIFKTKKTGANSFSHVFKNPQQEIYFRIIAGDFKSDEYVLHIIPKPIIEDMRMIVDYPRYTGKKQEVVSNTFDMSVPYGTRITWDLTVKNADDLFAGYNSAVDGSNGVFNVNASGKPNYRFSTQVTQNFNYQVVPYLNRRKTQDTLRFFIESIADAFPRIAVEEFIDSNDLTKRFFSGSVSDDYGFHSLIFKTVITAADGSVAGGERLRNDTLSISGFGVDGTFTYFLDLNHYQLQAGEELSYYFEVRDNDPFNGFKPSNSNFYSYKKQSLEEIREEVSSISENIEDKLSSTMEKMKMFKKHADDITKQLLEKKNLEWNDRKTLEDLIEMQKSLAAEYNQLSDEMRQRGQKEQQLNELNEDILQEQKELQELFDKVFDKETMAKLEELQRLLDENKPKDNILEGLEKLKQGGQDLTKELERNLELYKQLEFEKNLEKALEDLRNLKTEQLALKDKIEKADLPKDLKDSLAAAAALEEQSKINDKFDALRKDLDKLDKQNKALPDPNSFKNPQEKTGAVKDNLNKAADALKKNVDAAKNSGQQNAQSQQQQKKNTSAAAESQQKAADEMQELQDDLEQQQAEMEEEKNSEDAEFIRKLLKSVLRVSFKQEELLRGLGSITIKDPRYAQIIREQSALKTEIGFIADSINAISRRQPQVASYTNNEIRNLLDHSRKALERLLLMNDIRYRYNNSKNNAATGEQQYTMTSLNNIALLLEESLNRMDKKRRNSKGKSMSSSSASCDNPGSSGKKSGKKQSSGTPKEMQEALNKQLDALKKMMEERSRGSQAGGQNGSQQENQNGQQGKEFSEQFGKAVMQQEMIRRALQNALRGAKTDAATSALYNKILGDMERTERDLVNRTLTNETLLRQQQILTRLLEAERAELKREQEEKRESRSGEQFTPPPSNALDEFMRQIQGQKDVLRSATPALKPYYKDKVDRYYYGE